MNNDQYLGTKRYYSVSEYFIKTFGKKVYKLSLNANFSCPNRDGSKSTGGCIFCSAGGSGDFAETITDNLALSLLKAKQRIVRKSGTDKFIAYFQSYTNTYAPAIELEKLFLPVINRKDVVALSIATRPDCLPDDVLQLLNKLNCIKPVFVELGLQTIHDKTAEFINRCYPTSEYDTAVKKLKAIGVNVVTHLIIGLPGEDEQMIIQSAKHVAKSGADGIKLQLLHLLKNTRLSDYYEQTQFEILSLEKYTQILANVISVLPPSMVIHRITGDAPKKDLIEPKWSADKKRVLNYINRYFEENNVIQGSNYVD